jgi:hypothetical protein
MFPIGSDRFRSKAADVPEFGSSSGGAMDDFSKRLGSLEKGFAELRAKLDATLPHLATKADLGALRADAKADFGGLRADMNAMETRIVKWIVGALLSGIAVAVGIAQAISHILS